MYDKLLLVFQEGVELGKFSRISGEKSAEYVTKKLKDLGFIKDTKDEPLNVATVVKISVIVLLGTVVVYFLSKNEKDEEEVK